MEKTLENCPYAALIIPESFVKARLFHNRIYAFISIPFKIFDDTEYPVCLSLFVPEEAKRGLKLKKNDFLVFSGNEYLGNYQSFLRELIYEGKEIQWRFNDPLGEVALSCVDGIKEPSVSFKTGEEEARPILPTCRSFTRIGGLPKGVDLKEFVALCNIELAEYRKKTSDIFMAAFKGLRKDGRYRRRLDFADARMIMNRAAKKI